MEATNEWVKLKTLGDRLIDRRQRDVSKWQGIVQQYVDKVETERTLVAYDQLGLAVYELYSAKFMLGELRRARDKLRHHSPVKPPSTPGRGDKLSK